MKLFGYKSPYWISKRLFGDRKKFGIDVQESDPCWIEWQKTYSKFYYATQKKSIGSVVNNAGYEVLKNIDLSGKEVVEIGPGSVGHIKNWKNKPLCFHAVDINAPLLNDAVEVLKCNNIQYKALLQSPDKKEKLPFVTESVDIVLSFYSLEHLHPLDVYVKEIHRVLKPGGILVGAIPIEGGFAWGLGRFLTSRRWLKKNTKINPDKIICWEHVNFVDKIVYQLARTFDKCSTSLWPLNIPVYDINLILKFIYKKKN